MVFFRSKHRFGDVDLSVPRDRKMDRSPARLEPDPCPDVHLFCRAHARLTPPGQDVKGECTASAALDIQPHRRYVVEQVAAGFPRCRPESICSISTQNGVYTEFGIDPKETGKAIPKLTVCLACSFTWLPSFFAALAVWIQDAL